MVINIANFNFDGGSGGGGKPALLQEKTATIVQNGSQTIVPDEGFDGMSSVQINAAITGASSAIDFSSIGYDAELSTELNATFNNDVAYSKTLYDAWNPSNTSAESLYEKDTKLVFAPNIDTSNVTSMGYMFNGCSRLTTVPLYDTSKSTTMNSMFKDCISLTSVPVFDTSNVNYFSNMFYGCKNLTSVPLFDARNVTSMNYMFYQCSNLTSVPAFDTKNVTNMSYMFYGCTNLTSVPEFDTSNVTNFNSFLYSNSKLKTIEGISFKSFSASTMNADYFFGYQRNDSVKKAVFKDIGYQSTARQFNMSRLTNWGVNTDEIQDARQSLIDSLITYSFDRATAGYSTCTITLAANTKALLTSEEISQIEAKGYVIA